MAYNRLSSQDVRGRLSSSTQGMVIGSFTVMPEPTQYNYGLVVQYLGETTDTLIQNHLYRCVSQDGTYLWMDATPVVDIVYDADRVMGTNSNGLLSPTDISVGELDTLLGIESNIQEQIDRTNEDLINGLNTKVDKIPGKGLSEDDFTTREKEKLSSVAFGAQVNNIEEIQMNNVTVQPEDKIVNLSVLEGHTYPIGDLSIGQGFIVKHDLIRTVYYAQVRDGEGKVVKGDIIVTDTIAKIISDVDATDCMMYLICGGI